MSPEHAHNGKANRIEELLGYHGLIRRDCLIHLEISRAIGELPEVDTRQRLRILLLSKLYRGRKE